MYCPNCSNENDADKRFCRACGMPLKDISEAVGEYTGQRGDEVQKGKYSRLERFGIAMGGIALLMLLLALISSCAGLRIAGPSTHTPSPA